MLSFELMPLMVPYPVFICPCFPTSMELQIYRDPKPTLLLGWSCDIRKSSPAWDDNRAWWQLKVRVFKFFFLVSYNFLFVWKPPKKVQCLHHPSKPHIQLPGKSRKLRGEINMSEDLAAVKLTLTVEEAVVLGMRKAWPVLACSTCPGKQEQSFLRYLLCWVLYVQHL